jgi:two-component system, cell cycle sensor histidine kinase PleC
MARRSETAARMTLATPASTGRLPGGEIGRWTLRFRDAGVEREFGQQWLNQSLPLIRIWSVIGVLAFVAFGLVEWWIAPENIAVSFGLRYGVVLPIQIAFIVITYTRWHAATHAVNLVLATFLTNLSYVYLLAITPYPQQMIYYFMILLITLFTHGSIGCRFVHGFVASACTISLCAWVLMTADPEPKITVILLLVLFLVATISVFATYNQELHIRRDFRLNKLLTMQKRHSEELAQSATAANEAKSRFLAMMSHELRTPLNAIIGFAEIIAKQMFGPVQPERYREYADDIDRSGRHLLNVINGILDLSRATEGKLKIGDDTVDVADLLEECRRTVAPQVTEGGITLTVELRTAPLQLRADERMLRQILLNLLSNAIKFTLPGGQVEVSAEQAEDGATLVSIDDTGIGIAPEDLETAMTPFAQVDSSLARKYEGSGLGLPLAKTLTELHGGTLSLRSVLGEGTTAVVRFPPSRSVRGARTSATPAMPVASPIA